MGKNLHKQIITYVMLWGLLCVCPSLAAQLLPYADAPLTTDQGLSGNKITVLFQDSRGYLWIGTEDGLNRYNGYQMEVFRHSPIDSSSISDNYISSIDESPNGNLWIGTRNGGLNVWSRRDNRFSVFKARNSSLHDQLMCDDASEICGVMVQQPNEIWVKSPNYLGRIDSDTGDCAMYGHFNNVFKPGRSHCYPIVKASDSVVWVGTKDGLNRFNPQTRTFQRFAGMKGGYEIMQESVSDILPLDAGRLLLATPVGPVSFNPSNGSWHVISSVVPMHGSERINQLLLTSDKAVWLATANGVYRMDVNMQSYRPALRLYNNGNEINDEISAMLEDRNGIIWIGTRKNGVFRFDRKPRKFNSLTPRDPIITHLESYNFTSVLVDDQKQFWLGTDGKGLYVIDKQSEKVSHYALDPERFRSGRDMVTALCRDSKGNIWIGTNHGIYVHDPYAGGITEFDYVGDPQMSRLLKDNQVRAIVEDEIGNMWFGTRFGLYRYSGSTIESFFAEPGSTSSLLDDEINALMVDHEGWLWIGTRKGVSVYKISQDQFFMLSNEGDQSKLLSNDYVLSFDADQIGNVWIGTRSGLTSYHKATGATRFYTVANGLLNDVINSVACDVNNRVWVGTNQGISLVTAEYQASNFFVTDGLSGPSYNVGAVFKCKKGDLYFGGSEGLTYFAPEAIRVNNLVPNVSVSSIKLIHQGEVKEQWPGEAGVIEMKYLKGATLRVDYSTLDFAMPHKNHYKVFLEGYDEAWQPVTDQNFVTYSNLPAGDYVLKILGSNSDSVWNHQPTELYVTVHPPLWQTTYAFVFYIIILGFVLYSIINFNVRYYRRAYHELKEKNVDSQKIEAQKQVLSKINRSLTDSINYAKRIQEAMLPSDDMVKQMMPESFIYYRPKDIVSGDFYYLFRRNNLLFVAAVDCTGHGVPGAFMSIIGYDLLRNVIEVQGLDDPGEILMSLNAMLRDTFKKETYLADPRHVDVNDGMDMGLCVIDFDKRVVNFAGANHSLYVVTDNEIETYDGARMAIGSNCRGDCFIPKVIDLAENDILYMFTDGYADQFGGPEGKKFKYRRFRHLLLNIHKLPFEDQKTILHQKMEEWMGNTYEQIDDILLIGMKPLSEER
jgi:ligand-binding sensor domain-containing protein/serine phosphatase RsbU (regulator of sigma subunit)